MDAFPRDIRPTDGERYTGMVCPECRGNLVVRAEEPSNRLIFRCRVGHVYSAEDVVIGKEEGLEASLWAAVFAAEELAALLEDGRNRIPALDEDDRRQRVERLRASVRVLRDLIADDRSVKLNSPTTE